LLFLERMKKIAYILLFSTLVASLFYNALGYRMLFSFEQEQEWVTAMKKIPDPEFKVIHLNASLYTFADDTELEYVNENITINNKKYHIFKKQIKDNILNLYYLPNVNSSLSTQEIENIIDNQLFGGSFENKDSSKKIIKTFTVDYFIQHPECITIINTIDFETIPLISFSKEKLHAGFVPSFYSPPDFV
jgi:hypothetical protein